MKTLCSHTFADRVASGYGRCGSVSAWNVLAKIVCGRHAFVPVPQLTMEESQQHVIWSKEGTRWRIDIHETQDDDRVTHTAFVTGDMGRNAYRCRWMPINVLWGLAEVMERCQGQVGGRAVIDDPARVPRMPYCRHMQTWDCGAFSVFLSVHRGEEDNLSFTVAVYDADDRDAPVLWASDEEINQLIADLHEAQEALARHSDH